MLLNRAPALRLSLQTALEVRAADGVSLLPKARKARALLVLLALSESQSVSRRRAAGLLWSNRDSTTGLARLRNTLHDLRQGFAAAGIDVLVLENDAVSFRQGEVLLEGKSQQDGVAPDRASEFLADFEGIDPAFDRWLRHIRDERRQKVQFGGTRILAAGEPDARPLDATGPSIVVTPFDSDGTPDDRQFARAFTHAVTVAMARFRWFNTIVANSPIVASDQGGTSVIGMGSLPALSVRKGVSVSLAPGGGGIGPVLAGADPAQAADYALVGNLQRIDAQYLLTLNLISLKKFGAVAWASNHLLDLHPSFAEQERLAAAVAARLDSELLLIEAERQHRRSPAPQDSAYSLVLQAVPAIYRLDRDPFLGAGHVLELAVAGDRDSALAHSWLAYWHVFFVGQGWATNRFQAITQGGQAAARAMMLDPKDARAVTIAGHVKAFLGRRLDEATALHELALQLNPALPLAWHFSGMTHAYAGRLEDAFRCISECLKLAPTAPHGFFAEGALGIVQLLRGDHEASVAIGRRVTERHPHFTSAFKSYLAALGHLGRRAEAAEVRQRLLLLEPGFNLRRFQALTPYQRSQDMEHFTAGLRLAGVT